MIQQARTNFVVAPDGNMELRLPGGILVQVKHDVMRQGGNFESIQKAEWDDNQGERSTSRPYMYMLDEEDQDALVSLCHIIHGQADAAPLSLDIDQATIAECSHNLLRIAILADKYECTGVPCLQPETLLSPFMHRPLQSNRELQSLVDQASAAYILRHDRAFALFTSRLVLFATPLDWDPCHGNPEPLKFRDEIPDSDTLLDAVNERRLHCFEIMHEGISAWDPVKCPQSDSGGPKGRPLVDPDEMDKVTVCSEVLEDTDRTPLREAMDNFAARKLVDAYEVPLRQCLLHENPWIMTLAQRTDISADAARAVHEICLPCL